MQRRQVQPWVDSIRSTRKLRWQAEWDRRLGSYLPGLVREHNTGLMFRRQTPAQRLGHILIQPYLLWTLCQPTSSTAIPFSLPTESAAPAIPQQPLWQDSRYPIQLLRLGLAISNWS